MVNLIMEWVSWSTGNMHNYSPYGSYSRSTKGISYCVMHQKVAMAVKKVNNENEI